MASVISRPWPALWVRRSARYRRDKQHRRIPMGCFRSLAGIAGLCAAFVAVTADAGAQDAFYKGKRLAILVNYAPGGSTDAEARVFVRHLGRVLDGQPSVILQNMEGAGGFVGA